MGNLILREKFLNGPRRIICPGISDNAGKTWPEAANLPIQAYCPVRAVISGKCRATRSNTRNSGNARIMELGIPGFRLGS
jgi:hypothetical protein